MKYARFGIRTIAATTVAVAIFCLGYRLGYERGDNNRIDTLHKAVQTMTGNGEWMQLGGPEPIGGSESTLTTNGCTYCDPGDSGNTSVSPSTKVSDLPNDPFSDSDPFGMLQQDYEPSR